jgi:hypothetical protein
MESKVILVQNEPRGASQLIEVPVKNNAVQRIPFPDIQQLRSTTDLSIILKAIRLITVSVLSAAPTIGGANAPLTELVKMSLVLYCEGWEKGYLIPLLSLNDLNGGATDTPHAYQKTRFDNWRNVDWTKSYILLANGTQTAGAPYNVIFDVEYLRLDSKGQEVLGAR